MWMHKNRLENELKLFFPKQATDMSEPILHESWPIICSDWLIFQKSQDRFDYNILEMFIR
jgi:hypothetical protein